VSFADGSSGTPLGRDESEAVLAARAELGDAYDAQLAESFADRIEQVVEARVEARTGSNLDPRTAARLAREAGNRQMILGMVSLGTGIPITAISASITDLPGVIVAWAGIVGVNVAHALQGRSRG
jgi:hypothetical protein